MKAKVYITLKNGVLDPQGKAVQQALQRMDFNGVEEVRIGKFIEVDLSDVSEADAEAQLKDMCEKLLANTVIEKYSFELVDT